MKIFAFIFARGGSKGLPKKNIKLLGGIPLIGHSILVAKKIEEIAGIFVSTDDEDIASVARTFGAEVITRPADLASDTAPEWLAWQHAIKYLQNRGDTFDCFLSLPTTSPLRSILDVRNCLQALDSKTDVVVTVAPASRSPYFNMLVLDSEGFSKRVIENSAYVRRQDAPKVYDMTTVAYVSRPQFILNNNSLFSGSVKSVIIPKERAVDIDDAVDFACAEAIYRTQND